MNSGWYDKDFYRKRSQEAPVTVTRILWRNAAFIIARGADGKMDMGARSLPPEYWTASNARD